MKIKLRRLHKSDEIFISEWMNDPTITKNFTFSKHPLTNEQIHQFVIHSFTNVNRHYAIVKEDNEYLGTVSLKSINLIPNSAEYAIVLRKSVQGLGVAKIATDLILKIAFEELKLNTVYLNVYQSNVKAYKFYEKYGFALDDEFSHVNMPNELSKHLRFYSIRKNDYHLKKCRQIILPKKGDHRGQLIIVESEKNIPFDIKRVFYMLNTKSDAERGCHANRRSEFVFIALKGEVKVHIDNGHDKYDYLLNNPTKALYIPRMVWKEMHSFSEDSILLVLSNEIYDNNEYIRDYNSYIKEMENEY